MQLKRIEAKDVKEGMIIHRIRTGKNHSFVGKVLVINGQQAKFEILEKIDSPDSDNRTLNIGNKDWYPLEHPQITLLTYESVNNSMNDILSFIKHKDLSNEDKALIETQLENPSGEPTETGKNVLTALLWKKHREEIAKLAVEMLSKKEEKKA